MMKKRMLALALAAIMMVGILPASMASFDDEHSGEVSGRISAKFEEDVYSFTVPCDGYVTVQGNMYCTKYPNTKTSQEYKIPI